MEADRRAFMRTALGAGAAWAFVAMKPEWGDRLARADEIAGDRTPAQLAADESFWFEIQQAYEIDRSMINLNNGGVAPSPHGVHDALVRQLAIANNAPARQLWTTQDPQVELVRRRLAKAFGCDPEEMAITRNSSESLQICLNGIDLKRGDEILTTTHDYPRMISTIKQRAMREGVVMKQIPLPIPVESPDEIVAKFEDAITPRTRVILACHIVNITGEILPIKQICHLAASRNIQTIVDGAHAFAHFVYDGGSIGCDYYATSLHKWLSAPIGTGFLYVKRNRIQDLWPLTAAEEPKSGNIRKFEEIGTHPAAPRLAIAEALTFYEGIGADRKEERLRYLRNRWIDRLTKYKNVFIHTNLTPGRSCAIATVQIDEVDSAKLTAHLWDKHKILVTPIKHPDFEGIRVTPNVYTTLRELELFGDAMCDVAENGLPKPA